MRFSKKQVLSEVTMQSPGHARYQYVARLRREHGLTCRQASEILDRLHQEAMDDASTNGAKGESITQCRQNFAV